MKTLTLILLAGLLGCKSEVRFEYSSGTNHFRYDAAETDYFYSTNWESLVIKDVFHEPFYMQGYESNNMLFESPDTNFERLAIRDDYKFVGKTNGFRWYRRDGK